MQPWALITPASRGIGLQLARRLLQTTNDTTPIVATARTNLDRMRQDICHDLPSSVKDRLHVLQLDVTDESTAQAAAAYCAEHFASKTHHLRLAFSVAGILYPEKSPQQVNMDDALHTFRTNTLGSLLLIKHFSPFLPRKSVSLSEISGLPSKAIWSCMSARVGSISDNSLGGWYSYRASKAGVNQLVKTFDNHLKTSAGDKACAIALHPGTVKTNLSKDFWGNVKEGKLFEPEFAAERLLAVVNGLNIDQRGRCWDWKGDEIPP